MKLPGTFRVTGFFLLTCCFNIPRVNADGPIPITGTGYLGSDSAAFFITSPDGSFSASSAAKGWSSLWGICLQGEVCDTTKVIPVQSPANGQSGGSLNGVGAEILTGGISFGGSIFIPPVAPYEDVTLAVPITFQGELSGFQDFFTENPTLVWSVSLTGTGNLTLLGFGAASSPPLDVFRIGYYSYNGTATPIPEPATLTLFGIGAIAVALKLRRPQWWQRKQCRRLLQDL